MPSKWVPLIISLGWRKRKSHTKQDQAKKEVVPVWWCSSQSATVSCSTLSVPILFRHAQIFGDNLLNTFLFSCPTDLWSFQCSTDYYHTPVALPAWVFPNWNQNFRFIYSSMLRAEQPEKAVVQTKACEKEMQWL